MEMNEIELSLVSYKLHCLLSVATQQTVTHKAIVCNLLAQQAHNALINRGKN